MEVLGSPALLKGVVEIFGSPRLTDDSEGIPSGQGQGQRRGSEIMTPRKAHRLFFPDEGKEPSFDIFSVLEIFRFALFEDVVPVDIFA